MKYFLITLMSLALMILVPVVSQGASLEESYFASRDSYIKSFEDKLGDINER